MEFMLTIIQAYAPTEGKDMGTLEFYNKLQELTKQITMNT
jgi:hypothetical protein